MIEADLIRQLQLYLVADPDQSRLPLLAAVEAALEGGVTAVQLRSKNRTDRETLELGGQVRRVCSRYGALFIVNDRVDLALALDADGVHLGVDDLSVEDARRLADERFIIGFSPESDAQLHVATSCGASYLGIGPVFATASKSDAGDPIGLETLRRRVDQSNIPVVGIGGITASNAKSVIESGAVGVAVMSAVLQADSPQNAAATIRAAVTSAN